MTDKDSARKFLSGRLHEASTWRGLIIFLTAIGVSLSPDQAAYIISAGLGLAGFLGAVFPDMFKKPEDEDGDETEF